MTISQERIVFPAPEYARLIDRLDHKLEERANLNRYRHKHGQPPSTKEIMISEETPLGYTSWIVDYHAAQTRPFDPAALLTGWMSVRAPSRAAQAHHDYETRPSHFLGPRSSAERRGIAVGAALGLIPALAYVVLCATGGYSLTTAVLTPGVFIAFLAVGALGGLTWARDGRTRSLWLLDVPIRRHFRGRGLAANVNDGPKAGIKIPMDRQLIQAAAFTIEALLTLASHPGPSLQLQAAGAALHANLYDAIGHHNRGRSPISPSRIDLITEQAAGLVQACLAADQNPAPGPAAETDLSARIQLRNAGLITIANL